MHIKVSCCVISQRSLKFVGDLQLSNNIHYLSVGLINDMNNCFHINYIESAKRSRDKDKSRPLRREDWRREMRERDNFRASAADHLPCLPAGRSIRSRAFQWRMPWSLSGASPARIA